MPYPYLISADSQFPGTADLNNYVGNQPGTYGPFVVTGDVRYVVTLRPSGGAQYAGVWKSTDAGQTWAEQDGSNRPEVFVGAGYLSCSEASTTIWVFYVHPSTNEVTAKPFDTSSDTWGSAIGGGPVPAVESAEQLFNAIRMSSGDMKVVYESTYELISPEIIPYSRFGLATFDGSTWTDHGEIAGQSGETVEFGLGVRPQLVEGSSGRLHVFVNSVLNRASAPEQSHLVHTAIESDNTASGTWDLIDRLPDANVGPFSSFGQPTARVNGSDTEIVCGYIWYDGSNKHLKAARANSSATPSWTLDTVETSNIPTDNNTFGIGSSALLACGAYGDLAYIIWTTASDLRRRTYQGAGWSGASVVYNGDAVCNIAINPFADDFGIVLTKGADGTGDCYYYELGAVPPVTGSRAKYYSY